VGRTVGREREVLSPISSIWSGPFVRGRVLVFGPKPAAHELLPAVTKRIWLGIAILFLLIPNMMEIGKICLKQTFCGFLASEDLSCNLRMITICPTHQFLYNKKRH
jgi:hypothetical protein